MLILIFLLDPPSFHPPRRALEMGCSPLLSVLIHGWIWLRSSEPGTQTLLPSKTCVDLHYLEVQGFRWKHLCSNYVLGVQHKGDYNQFMENSNGVWHLTKEITWCFRPYPGCSHLRRIPQRGFCVIPLKRFLEMSHTVFFEMGNWSLVDDLTCNYFMDNGGCQDCRKANCQEKATRHLGAELSSLTGTFLLLYTTHLNHHYRKTLTCTGTPFSAGMPCVPYWYTRNLDNNSSAWKWKSGPLKAEINVKTNMKWE